MKIECEQHYLFYISITVSRLSSIYCEYSTLSIILTSVDVVIYSDEQLQDFFYIDNNYLRK